MTASDSGKRNIGLTTLCALALVTGLVTGVGAVVFRDLIGFVHNLFYYGRFSIVYDANRFDDPSPFGWFLILAPVIGGLIVVWIVETFVPEVKGHGVPEVMDAVFYKRGNIRGAVALVKSLASALSIGSGAAVGREGPIIQIGSALGSTFGRKLALRNWQKVTLLSAGWDEGARSSSCNPLPITRDFATACFTPSARTPRARRSYWSACWTC